MSETTEELERLVADATEPQRDAEDGWDAANRRGEAQRELADMAPALAAEVLARRKWETQAREALESNPCRCICDKCNHEHPWETCEVNMSQSQGPNRRDFPKSCGCKRFYGRTTEDAPGNCKKCLALAPLEVPDGE